MKILAVVKFNKGEAFVFDEIPDLVYTKYGNDTIIGKSGPLYTCYSYAQPSARFQAFGGSKFDITLSDGTIEHCSGQWWDGITKVAKKELNIDGIERKLIRVTAEGIKALTNCYVYCGFYAVESEILEMRKKYDGKVYEYYEFANEVINPIRESAKEEYRISITERIFESGFREIGRRKYRHLNGGILKFIDSNYFFIGSKTINNINELDIPKAEKDILLSIFGKTVKSCCVKKNGEVYIENEKCINYLYKYTS